MQLIDAYLSAHYLPLGRDELRLHVGRRALAVEREVPDASAFCLITACNPASVVLPEAENATRLAALRSTLRRDGSAWLEAIGCDRAGTWHEPSLLVFDLLLERVDALALHFGQNAVLHWRRGRAVRLRLYGSHWERALRAARVDTRFIESVACATR